MSRMIKIFNINIIKSAIGILFLSSFFLSLPAHAQDAIVTEKIIYAVNEEYAQLNPQWRVGAQDIIDYVNQVLALNTNKRYAMQEFKTLDIAKWNQLSNDPTYHYDNGYGGTTIFHWVETPNTKIKPDVHYTLLVNVSNYTNISGVTFQQLFIVENDPQFSTLLGENTNTFGGIMLLFLHEFGHTMGLSVPDWYFYEFDDMTGVEPRLPSFNLREQYPKDPMSSWTSSGYQFTSFNAAIINKNLRHEKTYAEIQTIASSRVRVIVQDVNGQRIPDATVKVFGGQKGCFYCREVTTNPVIETGTTSATGETIVTAPSVAWSLNEDTQSKYIGLIVKASKGDLRGGAYVIGQHMQQNKFLTGNDIFDLTIRLDTTSVGTDGISTTVVDAPSTDTIVQQSDPTKDSDSDGLPDVDELRLGTDPKKQDTDGDGYSDAEEVRTGHDPLKGESPKWKKFENKKFGITFQSPSKVNAYADQRAGVLQSFTIQIADSTAAITVYKKAQFLKERPWIATPLLRVTKNFKGFREDRSTKNRAKKAAGSGPAYLQWLKRKVGGLPALDHRYASPGGVGRSVYIIRDAYVYDVFHDRGYFLNKKGALKTAPYKDFEKFLTSIRFTSTKGEKK